MLSGKPFRHGAGSGILSQAHLNSSSSNACAEAAHTRPGCAGAQAGECTHSGGVSYPIVFLFRGGKTNTSPAGTTRLLPQYEFLKSSLAVAECAFDNGLSG